MKNFIYICAAIVLFGCTQTIVDDKPISGVFITGKIENPKSDFAVFWVKKGDERFKDTVRLDSTGQFSTNFNVSEQKFGSFYHGNETTAMFFVPGDSIHITINTEQFDESVTYTGVGASPNNYLAKKYLTKEQSGLPFKELYSLEPDAFISRTDSIRNILNGNLNVFLQENPKAPKEFAKNEKAGLLYSWALQRISYPEFHKEHTEVGTYDLGSEYYNYLADLNLDDSSLAENQTYKIFLSKYIESEAKKAIAEDTTLTNENLGLLDIKVQMAIELFKTRALSNYLLYNYMSQYIKQYGTNGIEMAMKRFEKTCTNNEYKVKVRESYELWKNLAKGKDAPSFTYPNSNENSISLSDFRGKYVYVDIWATWCGPCRRELPHLEKLQEKYADKDIVFLSVSIDEDKNAWIKMVQEKQMKGIQLIAVQGWESDICKSYGIKSIPRFLLIGQNGEIIYSKAERPSRGIEEILHNLDGLKS